MPPVDKKQLKEAIIQTLIEKGDYTTILKHLSVEEKESKSEDKQDQFTQLLKPISSLAALFAGEVKGDFMQDLTAQMDEAHQASWTELKTEIAELQKSLQLELDQTLSATKADLITEHLNRYQQAEARLTEKLSTLALEIVAQKADQILPTLALDAKLTPEEVDQIIADASLAVESQMTAIIDDYIAEQGITTAQITDFEAKVKALIPESETTINWGQIRNIPSNVGGLGRTQVYEFIRQAVADGTIAVSGDSLPDQTGNNGKFLTTDGTDASWATLSGGGDMAAATYDPQAIAADAFDTDNHTDGTTNKVFTATEKTKLGYISVTQAVDLDALETATHAAVTVSDSSEIDFTLTGQQISASIVAGSIDETKLDASVNASLDLADSALQPSDIASGTITARADDINFSGGSDGDVLTVQADGSLALEAPTGGSGTPAGSDTQIQFNDGGAFGGASTLTFNGTDTITLGSEDGYFNIAGADASTTDSWGSNLYIYPGNGIGSGYGGNVEIYGGYGDDASLGGGVELEGQYITIQSRSNTSNGSIGITSGGHSTGDGGVLTMSGGQSTGTGTKGGAFILEGGVGGDGGASNADGGDIVLGGGPSFSGTPGFIKLRNTYNGFSDVNYAILDVGHIQTTDKTFTFPNLSGTLALLAQDANFNTLTVNTNLVPDVNDGAALGTTAAQFSDLFLAEGGVINWDNGDATLTQTGNVLALAGARFDYPTAAGGVSALGNLGSTETFDWSTATNFTGNLDANITIDFSNAVSGQKITIAASYSGGVRTIAFTPTILWGGGVAPTGPDTGEVLVMTFLYVGTTYFGSFEIFS